MRVRFLQLWLLLAAAYAAGRLVIDAFVLGRPQLTANFWVMTVVIPLAQAAALLALIRVSGRRAAR